MPSRLPNSSLAPTLAAPSFGQANRGRALLRALRPKQWTKNLIVLIGAVFALKLSDQAAMVAVAGTFVAFCLLSSAGYLVNDVLDAEADRLHPTKRLRPVASGEMSSRAALGLATLLMVVGLWLSFAIRPELAFLATAYVVLTLAYSAYLKHLVLIDVFAIAAGFVLRVVGGAVAVAVPVSPWLYVCTVMAALFLGLAKRRQELASLEAVAVTHRRNLSEYTIELVDQLITIVLATTILAYSLYTFSAPNLPRNDAMMLTIPVVVYGLFRYLYLVRVKGEGGSPEELLLSDRPLMGAVIVWAGLSLGVLYLAR